MEEKVNKTENEQTAGKAQKTYNGGVTEEKINEWKKNFRKVFRVDVVDDGELHIGYFHRPDLEHMALAAKVSKTDEVRGGRVLFDNCWLGGSEDLRSDTVLFLSCMVELNKELANRNSSLKNL